MSFKRTNLIVALLAVIGLCLATSCSSDEPTDVTAGGSRTGQENDIVQDDNTREKKKSLTLIYAVASNNLEKDFTNDTTEMVIAGYNLDLNENIVLLYSLTKTQAPTLKRLIRKNDRCYFTTMKNYDNSQYSTDPRRINSVINDVLANYDADHKGIIFWSHAWGYNYAGRDHTKPNTSVPVIKSAPVIKHAYGQDDTDGTDDRCDIDELAEAIPDHSFDYIWFDCCFMGNVEVAFQLRNKADYVIGYPTEIAAEGMPYNLTMPYLADENPDVIKAADQLYSYFGLFLPFTVGVYRTEYLEELAEAYSHLPLKKSVDTDKVHNFARFGFGPFFDLGELAHQYATQYPTECAGMFSGEEFSIDKVLKKVVIYKAATQRDFSNKTINKDTYSGISVNRFQDGFNNDAYFYKRLDWYKYTK